MKKLTALILSAVLTCSILTGCSAQPVKNDAVQLDLTYWEENISEAEAVLYIGNTGIQTGDFDSEKVLELIKGLELFPVDPLPQYNAISLSGYGLCLRNDTSDKYLFVKFYNDFRYASVHTNSIADIQYYFLNENPRLVEYFESKDFYTDIETRDKVIGFAADKLQKESPAQIAEYAESADRTRPLPVIPQDLLLEEIGEISVHGQDGSYYGVEKAYFTKANAAYKDSNGNEHQYVYIFIVAKDESNEIYSLRTNMTEAEKYSTMLSAGEFYPNAQIAGISYAQWLHRLDNPYNNGFHYGTGKGSSIGYTSDINDCAAVISCIENLQLGEIADINFNSYEKEQVYTVALFEDNPYFEENGLSLHFVEDFKYVKVCDCEFETSICRNPHDIYTVKNPQVVLPLFENNRNASYVSTQDFEAVTEYAKKYITETPVEKLKEISGTDLVFPEGVTASDRLANITVDQRYSYPDKDGDFNVYFTALFKYPDEEKYLSYIVAMSVEKTTLGWKTNEIQIRM